jgi:hypothetical protein
VVLVVGVARDRVVAFGNVGLTGDAGMVTAIVRGFLLGDVVTMIIANVVRMIVGIVE